MALLTAVPTLFELLDKHFKRNSIVRLKKALYGLKQASRLWHAHINEFVLFIGFIQSTADPNLYIMVNILLLLYVDDILTCGDNVTTIKGQLQQKYKMKDLGTAQRLLGIKINRTNGVTSIYQKDYINTVLERFAMKNARIISSPMDPDIDLSNFTCQDKTADKDQYMSLIGSLMYVALATRPDISFALEAFFEVVS
jgi:hypothetical protein